MSEMSSIEHILRRFLDNRDSLSEAEFQRLLEALRAQPHLAELLKEHLIMDELLAQQFSPHRQDFIGRLESKILAENSTTHVAAQTETYALQQPAPARHNGDGEPSPTNGAARQHPPAELSSRPVPSNPPSAPHDVTTPWRTFFAVLGFLLLIAAGLFWLEFTPAARKIAVIGEVEGTAFLYRDDVGFVAAPGMLVLPGDEVRTPAEARIEITYLDQSRVIFRPETRAVLSPGAARQPGLLTSTRAKEIFISQGELEAFVQKQPAGRPMRLKSLRWTATVLGTRLVVKVEEHESQLEVIEGLVEVQDEQSAEPPVEVSAGYRLFATNNDLQVSPGPWPSQTEGLVFLLSPEAEISESPKEGVRILAEGPPGTEAILRPRQIARFQAERMHFEQGAFLVDDSLAEELLAACQDTNELSLEATVQTESLSQTGPARWITFSTSSKAWNFSLAQEGRRCVLRLLTATEGKNKAARQNEIPLFELPDTQPHHVVVTYAPGKLRCYLDGQAVKLAAKVQGTFANWTGQHVLFGDEWDGNRHWQGTLAGVAIYNRVLSADEAARNALHYRVRYRETPAETQTNE